MIISASRRTDIPAYYSEWFLNRLKAGYVLIRNPVISSAVYRIELNPKIVNCIVFWTKDAANILDKLDEINSLGYKYAFQFTVTPYGSDVERNMRPKEDVIKTFRSLSNMIGSERVVWRYDPIIFNDTFTQEYHFKNFERMCSSLSGYTEIVNMSVVQSYHNKSFGFELSRQDKERFWRGLKQIAVSHDLDLRLCCYPEDPQMYGIKRSKCIDKEYLEKICGYKLKLPRDKNQRALCECCESIDVGVYNTCIHGCTYCYATNSLRETIYNYKNHNPENELLVGSVSEEDSIFCKKLSSSRDYQTTLF